MSLPALEFVLVETLATKSQGRPLYYRMMTPIGPCTTADLDEAHRFSSKEDALRHPVHRHMLTFFEPKPVDESAEVAP